jgi:hypothetical protein
MRWPIFSVLVSVLLAASNAFAHDVWGVANPQFPPAAGLTVADLKKLIENEPDEDKRYVYERAILWKPGQVLKGCFIGGSEGQRTRIVSVINELLRPDVNIKIEFGDGTPRDCQRGADGRYGENIRISLQDGCCQAYVGRVAMNASVAKGPNVNISGSSDNFIIKHEILHALGFHHEHQKPANGCEFNYPAIQSAYGWTRQTVEDNFNAMPNSTKYVFSNQLDGKSIMKYYFSPELLVGGTNSPCYSRPVNDLSDEDWLGLKSAYPIAFDNAAHTAKLNKRGAVAASAPAALKEAIQSME